MSLASRFARGSTFMVLGTGADNIVQFVIFAILAQLLSIRDLGIVTFIILFIDISRIFVAGGLAEAIVQRPAWNDHIASVCFTYNLVMAVILALIFALIGAPLMEHFYGAGTGVVVASLGLIFLIEAVRGVHAAKLRREMNYRSLAVRGTIAGIVGGAIAIAMALAGAGVWALVFQRLCHQVVMTVLTWRAAGWTPKLAFDRVGLREVMPFGVRVTMTRGLEILNMRGPDLIVGFVLGPVGVAIYRVGARALDTLRRTVILPFQDASFSALSRIEDTAGIVSAFVRLNRAAATAAFPVFFGSTAIALELTTTLFGDKYAPSGSVFATLALAGVPNTMLLFAASAFMADGQPRLGTLINSILTIFNIAFVFALAMTYGTVGAAVGNVIALTIVVPVMIFLAKTRLDMDVRDYLGAILPPMVISILMAIMLWVVKLYLLPSMHPILTIAVLVCLGGALYLGMFALWGRKHLRQLFQDLTPLLPSGVRGRLQRMAWFS
ncbi:MAG: oligosaccharide flippase family protein [Sphingobium sp.]